ncbi:hypothetical protein K450DRAFT_243650 [Umbelopsis ramanniana AG]|uniref:DNA polymerase alpha catalytic subunit N-terminal domain-containing protein n=1 Tax=Umbelopsis ramanniana AG TaxID=1314678 RepID=A0AAD5E984_UMBRA|nr:uncharacterized protein K450DRAFT_243650 [Umbelopsis ramanniana AG]KAI8579057.1 hypothetical protein K450DRAFT_243650 [Umbelopsis ramanniana AG]
MPISPDATKRRKRTENKPQDKFSALRDARKNKTRLQDFQFQDQGEVYTVVEEGDYQMLARDRQNEDFVDDDDHAGYADGTEDWDEQRFSDEYSDNEARASADRKRKRSKKEKLSPTKPKNSLDQFFSRGMAERKPLTEKKNEKVCLELKW